MTRADTKHTDNRADRRIPEQNPPAELPRDLRHQERQSDKAGKAYDRTDRLADRDAHDNRGVVDHDRVSRVLTAGNHRGAGVQTL